MDEFARQEFELQQTGYDYSALTPDIQQAIKADESEMEGIVIASYHRLGTVLLRIKEYLPHGEFGKWLKLRWGWTDRTAQSIMNVARNFKSENFSDLDFAKSALYLLAAPSTPESAREEALERAETGEKITHKMAKEIKEAHLAAQKAKEEKEAAERDAAEAWESVKEAENKVQVHKETAESLNRKIKNLLDPNSPSNKGTKQEIERLRNELSEARKGHKQALEEVEELKKKTPEGAAMASSFRFILA